MASSGKLQRTESKLAAHRELRRKSSITRPVYAPDPVVMAGEMQTGDKLHIVNLLIALLIVVLASQGLFTVVWFSVHYQEKPNSKGGGERAVFKRSLWGTDNCDDTRVNSLLMCENTDGADKGFLTTVKFVGAAGFGCCIANFLMQIVSFVSSPRKPALQNLCVFCCVGGAVCLLLSGMKGAERAIFGKVPWTRSPGEMRDIWASGPGMLLLSVVGCALNGVFLHVASHSPGPLSTNTRFLYPQGRQATGPAPTDKAKDNMLLMMPDDPDVSTAV